MENCDFKKVIKRVVKRLRHVSNMYVNSGGETKEIGKTETEKERKNYCC